jgi:CzcA family heavy metal efflux pump
MLKGIVSFSLRRRGVVIALGFALLAYGFNSLTKARYDVFPEFAPPQVTIQTEAPGLAPKQVEVLVTQPIENAINGLPGIEALRSRSIQGLSVIVVVFRGGSGIYLDRQLVAERLSVVAGQLPAGVQPPTMTPLTSSTGLAMVIGMTSRKLSLIHLTTVATWTVRQRLLSVRGVSGVVVFGAKVRQLQVQFEPQQLIEHGLTVDEVLAAARRATAVRGAGFITTPNQRIVLVTHGQSLTPNELAKTVVAHSHGANITLGEIARVKIAPAPRIGGATIMGKPGLMLMVYTQYGTNTLAVTSRLTRAIAGLRPELSRQGIVLNSHVFRPADFIVRALHDLRSALLIGIVLIVVVLFLFLFNFRTAAISCTAIPLSLLAAVILLEKMGATLNVMTLGGLAIAIGEVVDDAVIDVENIYRRLRENLAAAAPRPIFNVILDASIEVRSAVVYATFAVILIFLPVITMSGLGGRIFSPLGVAYVWAVLASLGVALTLTPALCWVLLGGRDLPPQDPPLLRGLKGVYQRTLLAIERRPRSVVAVVVVLVLSGAATLPFLETSFLPHFREDHFTLSFWTIPGTSINQSVQMGERLTHALLKIPYVTEVAQRAGRAYLSDDTWGTYYSEMEVGLKPGVVSSRKAQAEIRKVVGKFAGVHSEVESFFRERMAETISGYTSSVVVNVFGNHLGELSRAGNAVAQTLKGIRGATDVRIQSPSGMPEVVITLKKEALARWGFDPVDVLDAVRTAYGGDVVGQVYQGNRVFGVSVILDKADRTSVQAIGSLPLRSPQGNYIPLHDLAQIYETSGRYVILHQGARRVQTITCNVVGRPVNGFVAQARRRVDRLTLPAGDYAVFTGTAEAQARSRRSLLVHAALAGLGIVLLLSVVMGNWRNLLLVLTNLPFALVGGVLTVWFTGGNLSLGSLVGFVTLLGITLRNSIMLISHYEHLVGVEGAPWGLETAMRGASERLAPILMTALVTGLGLLPLALRSGAAGLEIEGPMAIVILGGLFTSTILNLLVLPTLSLRFGRFEPRPPQAA